MTHLQIVATMRSLALRPFCRNSPTDYRAGLPWWPQYPVKRLTDLRDECCKTLRQVGIQ